MITELLPSVSALHLLHLHILLVFLHLLLSKLIFLSSSSNFILSLSHVSFFHLLFFNESWIRLHIDWNDQSCEGVSSNNSTIVHEILWSNLNILSIWITVSLLTNNLRFGGEALTTNATTIVLHKLHLLLIHHLLWHLSLHLLLIRLLILHLLHFLSVLHVN